MPENASGDAGDVVVERRGAARGVIMLASGSRSVRLGPALTVSRAEIDAAVAAVRDALCGG